MNEDLPITGNLARRGSVSKWKIDGKDQSISGAIYEYSMKSQDLLDTRPLTIPGESGGVTTPITTDLTGELRLTASFIPT